jgi:hypothetical protein
MILVDGKDKTMLFLIQADIGDTLFTYCIIQIHLFLKALFVVCM